jgi:hypothetical protein
VLLVEDGLLLQYHSIMIDYSDARLLGGLIKHIVNTFYTLATCVFSLEELYCTAAISFYLIRAVLCSVKNSFELTKREILS